MDAVERFRRFRELVLADAALQRQLQSIPDWQRFVEAATNAASEHGLSLSDDDVRAAREEARRTWREHWV